MIRTRVRPADAVRQTHIPAEMKRDVLNYVWREAGPEFLLSIGQGVREAVHDPIWRGALLSRKPEYLFEKWQRFEKFSHSSNRLRIEMTGEMGAKFERYTIDGGIPTPQENLLICGLITALLEEIGCVGLRCEMQIGGSEKFNIRENGRFALPKNAEELTAEMWRIDWRDFSPGNKSRVPETISLPISPGHIPHVEFLIGLLMADVSHQWKVDELAREAGLSKRSLQRKLKDADLDFSSLIRIVRIHEACALLTENDAPITSIAFCTGFSDSAHFSRDFRASMGMTPTDYRVGLQEN